MSTEQLSATEKINKPKFAKELELFSGYVEHFKEKAKKSIINRTVGKLSIGTEKGGDNIVQVSTQKSMDRELGTSIVGRALEASSRASKVGGIDMNSNTLGSTLTDESGIQRILTIYIDRSSDRELPTHGDMRDSLNFTVTTLGNNPEEAHSILYSVGLNGEVSMTGPEGDVTKVHANSDAASRMLADIDSFPAPQYPAELPY